MKQVYVMCSEYSAGSELLTRIRDVEHQKDRASFRRNMRALGLLLGYEMSKKLDHETISVQTPLGNKDCLSNKNDMVLGTILRAGLPMHEGITEVFPDADHLFVAAYRKHQSEKDFEIALQYLSCPSIEGKTLVLCDPMLATGASLVASIQAIREYGQPKEIHLVTAISSTTGIEFVQKELPEAFIWTGDLDEELNDKGYIIPGLGDAGDLSFGHKMQQ